MGSKKQIKSSLEEISIRGLGVIESSNIEFKAGLTVLTGETGAGKTMVLTALGLVLGSKSDSDLIRQGAERAVVTGKFTVPKEVADEVLELGGEIDDNSVIIARTISTAGKSRVLVGGAVSSTSAQVDSLGKLSTNLSASESFRLYRSLALLIKSDRTSLTISATIYFFMSLLYPYLDISWRYGI